MLHYVRCIWYERSSLHMRHCSNIFWSSEIYFWRILHFPTYIHILWICTPITCSSTILSMKVYEASTFTVIGLWTNESNPREKLLGLLFFQLKSESFNFRWLVENHLRGCFCLFSRKFWEGDRGLQIIKPTDIVLNEF